MNLFKRAFLFITRKRSKSILLILFIMANFVLAGLAVRNAAIQAETTARERLGGKFSLEADIDKLVAGSPESKSFDSDLVTKEATEKIAAADGVKDYNLAANRYILPDGFENVQPEKGEESPNAGVWSPTRTVPPLT